MKLKQKKVSDEINRLYFDTKEQVVLKTVQSKGCNSLKGNKDVKQKQ